MRPVPKAPTPTTLRQSGISKANESGFFPLHSKRTAPLVGSVKVLFVERSAGEGEYLRLHLAAFGYEVITKRKLAPEEGMGAVLMPVRAFSGMTPSGVPVVLHGPYDELKDAPAGVTYLIEDPLRPADVIRVLDNVLGKVSLADRTRAEVSLETHGLTPAQREVALYQLSGYRINRIAEALQVTGKTVKNHLTKVYQRYGVSGSVEFQRAVFGR